jgi:hypothetical protein
MAENLFMVRSGGHIWHVPGPGAHGAPLCGAELRGTVERLYAPSPVDPGDTACGNCVALQRLPQAAQVRALAAIGGAASWAGPLARVTTMAGERGQHIVLHFSQNATVDIWVAE